MATSVTMATLSEVAGVVHHQQHLPSEIVKNLRLNFKPIKDDVHEENKVQIRTSRHYKPEKDDKHWKNNYHRHQRQQSCGFYTPAHIPYQTIGKVGLDLKELVEESLEHLTKREQPDLAIWKKPADKERKSKRKETTIRFENKPNIQDKVPISKRNKERVTSPTSRCNGGLEEIRNNLRQHRQRKAAVRAGKPYFECLREEAAVKAITLMKEEKGRRDPCISPKLLRQMLSKMRVPERSESQAEGDETEDLPPEDSLVDILNQREVHDRSTRILSAQLRCLHTLLCYLYNLRTKDLRTKAPLSKDFLKTLRATIPIDHRGHIIRNTRQQTPNPPSRSRNTDHRASMNTIEYPRTEQSFPMGSPHMHWNESGSSISRVVGCGESSSGSPNIFQRKFGTRVKDGGSKMVEMTWSELVEGRSPTQQSGPPPPEQPSSRNAPGRSSFMHAVRNLFRFKKGGPHYNLQQITPNAQPNEQLPLWQQVASSEKNAKEAKSIKAHHRPVQHKKRPDKKRRFSKINDIIGQDYTQIRLKTASKVVEKLQQLSEQERTIFTQRLKAIQPARIYELNLKAMRQAGMEVHKEYDNDHVQPAKWFDELHEKAEILGVQDEPIIIECLALLHRFAVDQIQTVAYVKAKLCLIMLSIQMYDLCSLEMQEAVHFLMAQIMDISYSTWTDWLGQRKIQPLPPA